MDITKEDTEATARHLNTVVWFQATNPASRPVIGGMAYATLERDWASLLVLAEALEKLEALTCGTGGSEARDCGIRAAEFAREALPYVESLPGLGDRDTPVVWQLHRGKLDEIAGRPVTDEEVSRIAIALEFSSIPDAISDVIYSVCGSDDEDEDTRTADEMREAGDDPVDRAACEHGGLLLSEDPDIYDCTEGCGDDCDV